MLLLYFVTRLQQHSLLAQGNHAGGLNQQQQKKRQVSSDFDITSI
jgi:hypothetical protein